LTGTLSRPDAAERLLQSFEAYYDITRYDGGAEPLAALCEYYEKSAKYFVSKKAELWASASEEFVYLISAERFTRELFDEWTDRAWKDALSRAHIGPDHMATWVTPVFICDTADEDAVAALKKFRRTKSFLLSFHGWMQIRAELAVVSSGTLFSNRDGAASLKRLKKVLFPET
jgi:hypothetical protein